MTTPEPPRTPNEMIYLTNINVELLTNIVSQQQEQIDKISSQLLRISDILVKMNESKR